MTGCELRHPATIETRWSDFIGDFKTNFVLGIDPLAARLVEVPALTR
jgi:hypothetical protein